MISFTPEMNGEKKKAIESITLILVSWLEIQR
jgi:hypothetical protein